MKLLPIGFGKKLSGRDHSLVASLPLMVGSKSVWDNGHCHGYWVGPPTHFSEQVLAWRWSDLLLTLACSHAGLRFPIGVGSVIENTQIVFISESFNDFTRGVNIMTAPHVVVSIDVTRDKYLASYVSDQVWQISGGEVVVACDVDRKDSDGCTTQSHLDCYRLEVRVNLNHLVVESLLDVDQDSSTWQLIWIPPPWFAVAIIVGTSLVTQGCKVLQFCFLKAYGIRLMFAYQDIKIPSVTVLLIKFLPSLPVTAVWGSAPSAPCPPERATSGIATCSVVGDTYRPVAKLSPALGWWTLPCLACLWARIRARPAKQSTGWRNIVTNV